jgi:hypothetical protein
MQAMQEAKCIPASVASWAGCARPRGQTARSGDATGQRHWSTLHDLHDQHGGALRTVNRAVAD